MQKGYREKRIICSPVYAEVDLIPVRKDTLSRRAGGETSEKQQRANRKAAERHFVQLVNANFVQPDVLLVDPTYAGGEEPADFAEADRIRDELKAQGIEITDVPGGAVWKRI